MTIELTPLGDLDFPTPYVEIEELGEFEVNAEDVRGFIDYLAAESKWKEDVDLWLAAERDRRDMLMTTLSPYGFGLLRDPYMNSYCLCSPSRGAMFQDNWTNTSAWNDIFGTADPIVPTYRLPVGPKPALTYASTYPLIEHETPVGVIIAVICATVFITLVFLLLCAA